MNPVRRAALIQAAEVARKRKQRVSHIDRKLKLATVDQLKAECPVERDWPTAFGEVLHELSHLASACLIVGFVLTVAAIYSGVK